MWEDLHEGDVDERPGGQPLQHGLDQRSGGQLRLHHRDADGDAQGRHEREHYEVGGDPDRTHLALDQLHRQAEDDDALVDQDSNADFKNLQRT